MKDLEDIACELRRLMSRVEDVQRELIDKHSCLGVEELTQAWSRLNHVHKTVNDHISGEGWG